MLRRPLSFPFTHTHTRQPTTRVQGPQVALGLWEMEARGPRRAMEAGLAQNQHTGSRAEEPRPPSPVAQRGLTPATATLGELTPSTSGLALGVCQPGNLGLLARQASGALSGSDLELTSLARLSGGQ